MKYIKLLLNIGAAAILALFTLGLLFQLYDLISRYPASLEKCGPSDCPSLFWTIGVYVVFPFWIYKFGKYLYANFLVEQKFYRHVLILANPLLMFFVALIWFTLDFYGLDGLKYLLEI